MSSTADQINLAIPGSGGISALIGAAEADEQGIKGVHIFSRKRPPVIHAREFCGQTFEMAAEFVDKKGHDTITKWVKKMGLELIPAKDQQNECFQLASGKVMSSEAFLAPDAYGAIGRQVKADREEALRDPVKKAKMDKTPLADYMEHLAKTVERVPNRSWFKKAYDFITGDNNRVPLEIVRAAMDTYTSEAGLLASKISALYFAFETSPDAQTFLKSRMDFRIQGGTKAFTEKLKTYLANKGVSFHEGMDVQSIEKTGDGLDMDFIGADGKEQRISAKQAVIALPDNEAASIKGMKELGMSEESLHAMRTTEGTHWGKVTVALTPEAQAKLPVLNFFGKGFQCWQAAPGTISFLCDTSAVHEGKIKPSELIQSMLSAYARGNGMAVASMVDQAKGMLSYIPKEIWFCSGTGELGSVGRNEMIATDMKKLATNGIAIANSSRAVRDADGTESYGFMNNGAHSAQAGISTLIEQSRMRELAMSQQMTMPAHDRSHAGRHTRTADANAKGGMSIF